MEISDPVCYARLLKVMRTAVRTIKWSMREKSVGDGRLLLLRPVEKEDLALACHLERGGGLTITWQYAQRLTRELMSSVAEYLAYVSSAVSPAAGFCNPDAKAVGIRLSLPRDICAVLGEVSAIRMLLQIEAAVRSYAPGLDAVADSSRSPLIAYREIRFSNETTSRHEAKMV